MTCDFIAPVGNLMIVETVGELLRHWRNRRGISQLDLAIAADVSARHVSLVETGKSNPSADMVLRHVAEEEGKPVEGLETLQFQLNMFNRMPVPAAPAPSKTANGADPQSMQSLSDTMSKMQSAWKRGDQSVFVQLLDQLRTGSPDTYRMMFTERNARWADWIAARMQTPGTVFVAVGAGHLAGKDSVLVRLAEKGIESQRVY